MKFAISVKGIVKVSEKYLLRHNERNEWELLGGKLESDDQFLQDRLAIEFVEESGITIRVIGCREPWLYIIGKEKVLICPFFCEATCVPTVLFDADGGTLGWHAENEISSLNMPVGYLHSILNVVPDDSRSNIESSQNNSYKDDCFTIELVVNNKTDFYRFEQDEYLNPRDYIAKKMSIDKKNLLFRSAELTRHCDSAKLKINFDISDEVA